MSQPSALESAGPPTEAVPLAPTRCVLLIPGAVPSAATESPLDPPSTPTTLATTSTPPPARPPTASPRPAASHREVEDEAADPVGDGHSDADLARRLDGGPTAASDPLPQPDNRQPPENDRH